MLLNGAAITIQSAWRAYRIRREFEKFIYSRKLINIAKNSQNYLNRFSDYCFKNEFLADVILFVGNQTFYCHSVVLWANSTYLKYLLETYDYDSNGECSNNCEYSQNNCSKFKYKFELMISVTCWEVIQKFIYGYAVEFEIDLLEELVLVCDQLGFSDLTKELETVLKFSDHTNFDEFMGLQNDEKNFNQNNNLSSASLFNADLIKAFDLSQSSSELFFIEKSNESFQMVHLTTKQPLQILSSFYKFFKCVLHYFGKKKLSLDETLCFLSADYINYFQMNLKQISKCKDLIEKKIVKHQIFQFKDIFIKLNEIEDQLRKKVSTLD